MSTSTTAPHPFTVAPATLRRVVYLARRAPSVHNTQPWRWRSLPDGLELWADRSRALPACDPQGRTLVISCGTALHHAVLAAEALGLVTETERCPDRGRPDLLARLTFSPNIPPPNARDLVRAIEERCTDRRRFTSWPVPDARVEELAREAATWDAVAVPITNPDLRLHVELLAERARLVEERDPRIRAEADSWRDRGPADGVPSAVVPDWQGYAGERPNRYSGSPAPRERTFETSDGVLAICTPHDDPRDWLAAGVTLSALWLQATREGLSVVPLSQVTEVPTTRRALEDVLSISRWRAQLLVRLGWQQIGRGTLPRTPRRPLEDVLDR